MLYKLKVGQKFNKNSLKKEFPKEYAQAAKIAPARILAGVFALAFPNVRSNCGVCGGICSINDKNKLYSCLLSTNDKAFNKFCSVECYNSSGTKAESTRRSWINRKESGEFVSVVDTRREDRQLSDSEMRKWLEEQATHKKSVRLRDLKYRSETLYERIKESCDPISKVIRLLFPEVRNTCIECGSKQVSIRAFKYLVIDSDRVFSHFCSSTCRNKNRNYQEKLSNTLLERYGSKTTFGSEKIQKKCRETNLARYGAEYYRGSTIAIQNRLKKVNYKEIHDKVKATHLKRYGYEYTFQNRELFEKQQKAGFSIKDCWIGNKHFQVRGYEEIALHYLNIELGVSSNYLKTESIDGMPSITWLDYSGDSHVYHPDIYAKVSGDWWLIEVKSTYTCGLTTENRSMWSVLKKKSKACDEAGYNFILLVVDKNKVYPVYQPWNKTRKDLRKLVFGE